VSGDRISRPRRKLQKTARPSRSLSTRQKAIADKYKTPAQKIPPSIYGTVTPKIKPNMPQVILRRPIQGEVVLSMQGSPLLAGSVSVDNIANVNVPLEGGRLFSIQPQKGLRLSQIPELDPEIKRQLETLRDNLNKVCALPGKRK
jgi:borealin